MALPEKLQQFVDESAMLDKLTRSMLLLDYATKLGDYPDELKDDVHRVRGCTSLVYLDANFDEANGVMRYTGFADAQIVKGMVAVLVYSLDGETPENVLSVDPSFISEAGLSEALSTTRQGGLTNILERMQNAAQAALAQS